MAVKLPLLLVTTPTIVPPQDWACACTLMVMHYPYQMSAVSMLKTLSLPTAQPVQMKITLIIVPATVI